MNNYELIKLNTARNALKYIIRAFNIKELYIPYYICPALRIIANKECKLKFYHIDEKFKPVCEFPKNAYILYINYFGVCDCIVNDLAKKYINLIVDNAHSFFSEPKGIACFYSLRKFFPKLRDGAFLYTSKTIDLDIEQDTYKYTYKALSYEELIKNENRLDNEDIKYISKNSELYFSKIDIEEEKQKFLNDFIRNHKKYNKLNKLKFDISSIIAPYKYPYFIEDSEIAEKLVKEYEKSGKLIFRYWNNLPNNYIEKDFYLKLVVI